MQPQEAMKEVPKEQEEEEEKEIARCLPQKKHSGPRKRRPRKKKTQSALSLAASSTRLCPAAKPFVPLHVPVPCAAPPLPPPLPPPPVPTASQDCDDYTGFILGDQPVTSPTAAIRPHARPPKSQPESSRSIARNPSAPVGNKQASNTTKESAEADDLEEEKLSRAYWTRWAIEAAEQERARRLAKLRQLELEEQLEIQHRRAWALKAIEQEQEAKQTEWFLDNMKNTQWFQNTISRFSKDYEVMCPNSWFGCTFSCMLRELDSHLEHCAFRQVPEELNASSTQESEHFDFNSYDVVCPNAVLGCKAICKRDEIASHLAKCSKNGLLYDAKEQEERKNRRKDVILASELERQRRIQQQEQEQQQQERQQQQEQQESNRQSKASPRNHGRRRPSMYPTLVQRLYEQQKQVLYRVLHEEIHEFVALQQQNLATKQRQEAIQGAMNRLREILQRKWPQAHMEPYGSFVTHLYGPSSDVDLVVLQVAHANPTGDTIPLTSQTCVSVLATLLREFPDLFTEINAITRASIPVLKVLVTVQVNDSVDTDVKQEKIWMDITFDEEPASHVHNGIASAAFVQRLCEGLRGFREICVLLKHFLAKRNLMDPYVGGLSSYGLLLMVLYVIQQHPEAAIVVRSSSTSSAISQRRAGLPVTENERALSQRKKGYDTADAILDDLDARQRTNDWQPKKKGHNHQVVSNGHSTEQDEGISAKDDSNVQDVWLGKLLMTFLEFYANDFRVELDKVDVLITLSHSNRNGNGASDGSGSSSCETSYRLTEDGSKSPATTNAVSPFSSLNCSMSPGQRPSIGMNGHGKGGGGDDRNTSNFGCSTDKGGHCLVIRDPFATSNNIGKNCYRVSQLFRDFSDLLSLLLTLIVRNNELNHHHPFAASQQLQNESETMLNVPTGHAAKRSNRRQLAKDTSAESPPSTSQTMIITSTGASANESSNSTTGSSISDSNLCVDTAGSAMPVQFQAGADGILTSIL